MHTVNTFTNNAYTHRCIVKVDDNGHYHLERYFLFEGVGWAKQNVGRTKFKHIESVLRAVNKWIK